MQAVTAGAMVIINKTSDGMVLHLRHVGEQEGLVDGEQEGFGKIVMTIIIMANTIILRQQEEGIIGEEEAMIGTEEGLLRDVGSGEEIIEYDVFASGIDNHLILTITLVSLNRVGSWWWPGRRT